jgi:hypothetical protein
MAPITFTPEEGKAALEAAYQGARDDNWDGAGFRMCLFARRGDKDGQSAEHPIAR